MESALYSIYPLVVFVSEILLVRCAHSFNFWYVNNLCVNTVRQHFPWSILYVTFEGGARSRRIGSNYENYWLDLIRRTIKSYRIVNQLFTATGFEDNKLTPQPSSPYPAPPPGLLSNSPFPSCLKPLFQREAKCKATDAKLIFYSYANKTHLHKKGFAVSFILMNILETQKCRIHIQQLTQIIEPDNIIILYCHSNISNFKF